MTHSTFFYFTTTESTGGEGTLLPGVFSVMKLEVNYKTRQVSISILFNYTLQCNLAQIYSRMISAHRDMFAVCAITLLCCVSVSQSAPLACEDSARSLDQLDSHHLEARWALVAGSLSDPAVPRIPRSNDIDKIAQYFLHI